jgi:Ni/Co efflux regulator RcnB
MKKLAIILAVGAAALMTSSAGNAADNSAKAPLDSAKSQSTDFSSRHRHGHWRGHHHHHRHFGHRHYRPHYNSYNYYQPRPYGYYGGGPRYYGGGPGVTFSFGSGGYRGW